jgi:glycosyltransferase involved in cell wall biosynthesis
MQTAGAMEEKRHRPDVVFVGREDFLEGVLPWAKARGLPVISRVPSAAELIDRVYGAAASRIAFDLVAKADRIIAPAHHIAAGLANHGISNVTTIQNPVDSTRFQQAPVDHELAARLGLKPEHVVVAHASNMKPVKRVCDIASAAAATVIRDPRLIFLIIGDGPDREKLEQAVLDRGLTDHFRFTDWLDHAACGAHLRLANMALMPSATEGLASAYLEAMATGLPLLASDVAGAREVVDDGENGFLFPVGDIAAIADLIVKVAADPALRNRIGTNARAYVEQNHRLEAAGDLLREVVTEVVGQRRAVGAQ